jgi:DNA processing protein
MSVCDECLRHAWLLARLAGHLDHLRRDICTVLGLDSESLVDAVAGRHAAAVSAELGSVDPGRERAAGADAGLALLCRCADGYPERLRELVGPPRVLHVACGGLGRGVALARLAELARGDPVAIVGARRATEYGRGVARSLAADLASAGVPVISGMALGIDGAAHTGTLERGGLTAAVLPCGAERAYPAAQRALYARTLISGFAVSELPPGTLARRWSFLARNRIIAGLAAATVVVEAGERSGALLTAAVARALGRPVGAVPGRVGTAQATGPNALLAGGAAVIRDAQDVLDLVFGVGARPGPRRGARAPLEPELEELRAAIADGCDTAAALARAGIGPARSLVGLAALELAGHIRREPGGRYAVVS